MILSYYFLSYYAYGWENICDIIVGKISVSADTPLVCSICSHYVLFEELMCEFGTRISTSRHYLSQSHTQRLISIRESCLFERSAACRRPRQTRWLQQFVLPLSRWFFQAAGVGSVGVLTRVSTPRASRAIEASFPDREFTIKGEFAIVAQCPTRSSRQE